MSSQFSMLWSDLVKTGPMTKARDTNFERDRKEIMFQLGMIGGKSSDKKKSMGPLRAVANKHHGKKARALANEAHQKALYADSKTDAIKRLEVQTMVHEVESKNVISKEMAKYVKAQQPIPPRLMKALIGGKISKPKTLPPLIKKKIEGYQPPPTDRSTHVRKQTILQNMKTNNKWPIEERKHLIQLYKEIEKPQNAQVELWKIYYNRLSDRYRSLYPHRKAIEITDKLQEMITKRQFHDEKEIEHWKLLKGNKTSASANAAIAIAAADNYNYHRNQSNSNSNSRSVINSDLAGGKSIDSLTMLSQSPSKAGSQSLSPKKVGGGLGGSIKTTRSTRGDQGQGQAQSQSQNGGSRTSRVRSPITVKTKRSGTSGDVGGLGGSQSVKGVSSVSRRGECEGEGDSASVVSNLSY
jgi:hypothetical protein